MSALLSLRGQALSPVAFSFFLEKTELCRERHVFHHFVWQAIFRERFQERFRIEFFDIEDALSFPLALKKHHCRYHGRHSGGVRDRLRADLFEALRVVADIVDVSCALFFSFNAGHDASDDGLTRIFRRKRRGVGKERLQKFHWDDLLALEIYRVDARYPDGLHDTKVREVILPERHPETHTLQSGKIFCERFHFLVEQQVTFFWTGHRIVERKVDTALVHDSRCPDPLAITPMFHLLSYFSYIYLRIEVRRERLVVAPRIGIEDIDETHLVEIFL